MKKSDEKKALCVKHRELLQILVCFGKGAMLLKQLRAICLKTGLYPNEQAVNRAARNLRAAGVLTRQTWVDGNSDLILACKAVYEFLQGVDSRGAAPPPRPSTMAPYILQARKMDWLLAMMESHQLDSPDAVERFLRSRGCTVFLRQTELLDYYMRYRKYLSGEKVAFDAEVRCLRARKVQQESFTSHRVPADRRHSEGQSALEKMHRRGIYITRLSPQEKMVYLILFPERTTNAQKIMDWAIEACWWTRNLLPGYRVKLTLYTYDEAHSAALKRALQARTHGQMYWHARLASERIDGMLDLGARSTDFTNRWCGGVRAV